MREFRQRHGVVPRTKQEKAYWRREHFNERFDPSSFLRERDMAGCAAGESGSLSSFEFLSKQMLDARWSGGNWLGCSRWAMAAGCDLPHRFHQLKSRRIPGRDPFEQNIDDPLQPKP